MNAGVIVGGSTDQFCVGRDSKDTLHPFQVDRTHMFKGFDELLLFDAVEQSLFALQGNWSHRHCSLFWTTMVHLISLYGHIKLYVATKGNVKVFNISKRSNLGV